MAVALPWSSGANALILALAELLLLLLLVLRWLVRRQGGWRRAWRRLTRQVRLTFGAFSQPVQEFLRFRATVRQLTRLLASGVPAAVAHQALDHVDTAVQRSAPDAFAFAAAVRPVARRSDGEVTVQVAGRRVPGPVRPWQTSDDPLFWYASAADVEEHAAPAEPDSGEDGGGESGEGILAGPRVLVPLGLADDAAVFVDLLRGPRVLSTYGDRRTTRAFVQAVAAYLDLPGGEAEVVVARGVHPRFDGPDLDSLLASVTDLAPERTRPLVVVCAAPDDDQSALLCRMAAEGLLCAVVVGQVTGHRLEVRVNSRGRTETPGLGIETDAAPLGPAVARTARKGGSRKKAPAGRAASRRRADGAGSRPPGPSGPNPPGLTFPSGNTPARTPPAETPPAPSAPASGRSAVPTGSTAPSVATPAPASSALPRAAGHPSGPAVPGARRPSPAPAMRPSPASEPVAPAIRDLFAEPEITGVSAAGDAESSETPREEGPYGS
jgi:hypothetical protein